ncbi:MAG TPA: tRNA (guanosine(46)-N7)-methyltransferase TrmB [Gammaproteobacteria bacterium]|nr:tRNA (guanosine(46)-N7)-methyltransferase TrmB [Gammaproteobacteria bacterium]
MSKLKAERNRTELSPDGTSSKHRNIKSFVLRQGRLTLAQQHALEHHWKDYGIEFSEQVLSFKQLFDNDHETFLEIGFGNGESLLQQAKNQPQYNFVGIEVHGPGVGHLIHLANKENLRNIKVIRHDAVEVLAHQVADASLKQVQLFFPDPWHKKRHHKRRIIQPDFITLLHKKLKPGGLFHMATDWQHYAEQMLKQMDDAEGFHNTSGSGHYSATKAARCETKFERRGLKLGHGVWDLIYEKGHAAI